MDGSNGTAPTLEANTTANQNSESDLSSSMDNPIHNLIASLRVLPSAQQAFDTSSLALNQNGAVFMEILAGLQTSIRGMDSQVFSLSPRSVIDKHALPPIPNSLFRTPLRDRKRVRQAQEQESQLLNTGLNVKPKLVLVPDVPTVFRTEIDAERIWESREHLQSTLHRYQQTQRVQSMDPNISLEVAEWHSPLLKHTEGGNRTQKTNDKHQNVYLKVNLGASTGLWGYICFARRKRRYDGRYQNRERSTDLASSKRVKATPKIQISGQDSDEDEDGYAVIATRYHLFSEVELNKSKNDISGFRWIQELCMHLNHIELSLPELLVG
ncbi:hypothetical protein QFC21_002927 [Naganishia friedmannii]|uniref:Uncharacterized protein n=1 Tax=Naganishia friedmannii TaxID=89922 RepID=A0ACC2VUQ8_9TREE|nr:hypothetical protein QFC21_002927 [Naganishia friedmannii]